MSEQRDLFDHIKAGRADEVRALLQASPDLSAARDDNGVSAIMVSVYHGQSTIAQLLAGCRELDLYEACALGDLERVRGCLETDPSSLNSKAPDGFPPLGLACFFGHPEVTELLLRAGADPNAVADNAMRVAPIHGAVAGGQPDIALENTRLLVRAGADVNLAQHGGWRALHSAAASGADTLVDFLLASGAEPAALSDEGKSASQMAADRGHHDLAARLTALGG